ncbi:MAG: T9SS type A sorting domain-containing protein [Rhizobacter sp.]|nr:T9SS type A sorting domain-containing protein [Chlorobiales bacterium]
MRNSRTSKFTPLLLLLCFFLLTTRADAQTVKVKFRYQSLTAAAPSRVHFPGNYPPGTTNDWGPNNAGVIAAGAISQGRFEAATGLWVYNFDIPYGTYEYKINENGVSNGWRPDPLNRVIVQPDQNSQLVVNALMLFQIAALPYTIENSTFVVKTPTPRLTAGVFRSPESPNITVDAFIDGAPVANAINYLGADSIFSYSPLSPLADGNHVFKLTVGNGTLTRTDSVNFAVRARPLQIQSPAFAAPFATRKEKIIVSGIVIKGDGTLDSGVSSLGVFINNIASTALAVTNGKFADSVALADGLNTVRVVNGADADSVQVRRLVNHTPVAKAVASDAGSSITLDAGGTAEPDGQAVTYTWLNDVRTPLGINETPTAAATQSITKPTLAGEYYYTLIAADTEGNRDTTRNYFTVKPNGVAEFPVVASNPLWAKEARVYFLFPKAATNATSNILNDLVSGGRLQYIKDMGFNVIWMMPVMKTPNNQIDNGVGIGYNIVDFNTVVGNYGTNADFKNFVEQAHAVGLKIILDVTPNHTSRFHSWSEHAHTFKQNSPYWNWYQHESITHNTNGLGQSADADNFWYYSAFSDQLLNYNWTDLDARETMIDTYKYWINEFGLDGFRFDVYWGPHRRYGEAFMGKPLRDALKRIKPDILLLGEDDGTGSGTETIYADYSNLGINGGVDAAYDFKLYFNAIRNFGFNSTAIDNLHNEINNAGFYPGENSLYMRFMESQDEDRIYYNNPSPTTYYSADPATAFSRTRPMASVVFTVPGFPMLWTGQEVGWGYGLAGNKEARSRSIVDWNFQGKGLLTPHYQRLAHIRGQFKAFTQNKIDVGYEDFARIASGNADVYAFARPYENQNAVVVVNFSAAAQSVTLNLSSTLRWSSTETQYYLNDLYTNTTATVQATGLGAVNVSLAPYGTAIYTVSKTQDAVVIPNPLAADETASPAPKQFELSQNYPNPFNPATTIRYQLPSAGDVKLKVYDVLGREVASLVNERQKAGSYAVSFNASKLSSGVYFYRLTTGNFVQTKKMLLIK